MSEQDGRQASTIYRPTTSDPETWKAYWEVQGQSWRSEPEIDPNPQMYLTERRTLTPDYLHHIYAFTDIQLNRADIEWLLATHENGQGPVDWHNKQQRNRRGLDLLR